MYVPPPPPTPPPAPKKPSPLIPLLVFGAIGLMTIVAAIAAGLIIFMSKGDRDDHPPAPDLPVVEKPREPEPPPAFVEPEAQKPTAVAGRPETPPAPEPRRETRPAPPARTADSEPGDAPPPPRQAVRVGGDIPAPAKLRNVSPVYPQIAVAARVQGTVVIEATIGRDGTITDTRVTRSIPLLDQAALDAVRQWEYEPTRLNGEPVPVIMTVSVNFKLQ